MERILDKLARALPTLVGVAVLLALLQGPTPGFAGEATLSWDLSTAPDVAGYNVYFGTSSGVYGTPIDAGVQPTYTVTGLTISPYYFAVTAYDTAGEESPFSNEATKTIADSAPPVVTALSASGITSTGATITWTTSEAATSLVEYGTTSAYGSSSSADSTLVISHSQSLPGLTPGTTYHFRVHSADATGNVSRSVDQTLTTPTSTNGTDDTPPEDPRDFSVRAGDRQVALTWTNPPDADFVGVLIRFRTDHFPSNPSDGELLGDFTGQPNELMSTVHTGLQNGVTYYYSASSYDSNGNLQSTVHAWAIPSDSTNVQETGPTGGCGMIRPVGETRSGPGQAADLIALLAIILIMACRRAIRRPRARRCAISSLGATGTWRPRRSSGGWTTGTAW